MGVKWLYNNFETDLERIDDEALKYVGVTNLDFRTHLSPKDLEEVKNIIFSINTLLQITFKDGTDISDIENVKHLLELSPMCDDKKIEKLILRHNSEEEVKKILSMPYDNPDTWNIAYHIKDESYMLTTVPNYRLMEEYVEIVLSCIDDDMSQLEKVKEVYDFVKLLEYDANRSDRLPEIVQNRCTDNSGYSLLLEELLKRVGISSYVGQIMRERVENVVLVDIRDNKYGVDGIYVFDPFSDSIPKNVYKSDAIRKVNYNFFAVDLKRMEKTTSNDKLWGTLSLLGSDSLDFSLRHINLLDKQKLEEVFGIKYDEIYERIKHSPPIDEKKLLNLFTTTFHQEDFLGLNRDVGELLTTNYQLREKELFIDDSTTEFNKINLHDA